jgi:2-polyprenyl-3-methyl-5-hydroxy-6-metoxy-1,4-benzoquinol methylase
MVIEMYENLIRELSPKPKFNLKWYNHQDSYSEGEIEDLIIKLIAENEPEDYVQAIADNYCWSTYYHLTHVRKNILNWYPFSEDASVLEIGCGMGAITNMLCEKCRDVTAVELSQKRATGALLRCREKENLEIIVGNLNDIQFQKKFDYITLIGVLEYQGSYTDTANPYCDFLKKIRGLLKKDGKLLIAIENQYGLKYWCGAREDHTGVPFDGMNQYSLTDNKVRTFSKEGLDRLIKSAGFQHTYFYYPMPDYKLPTVVYSQNSLPQNETLGNADLYYIPNNSTMIADEKSIYKDVIQNGVFEFFANSFLVECSDSDCLGEVTFATLPTARQKEYQVGTKFTAHSEVIKFPLGSTQTAHIRQILKNESGLKERGIHVWGSEAVGQELHSPFLKAETLDNIILKEYDKYNAEGIYAIFDRIYSEICTSSEEAPWQDNILYTFDLGVVPDKDKFGKILKTGCIDMLPRNAFWHEETIYWFDQEWVLENVPAGYIMFRVLREFFLTCPNLNNTVSLSELILRYQLFEGWEDYRRLEDIFMGVIVDALSVSENSHFCSGDTQQVAVANIGRLLNG